MTAVEPLGGRSGQQSASGAPAAVAGVLTIRERHLIVSARSSTRPSRGSTRPTRRSPATRRSPSRSTELKQKAKEGTLTRSGAAAWYAMVQELRRLADYYERDLIRQLPVGRDDLGPGRRRRPGAAQQPPGRAGQVEAAHRPPGARRTGTCSAAGGGRDRRPGAGESAHPGVRTWCRKGRPPGRRGGREGGARRGRTALGAHRDRSPAGGRRVYDYYLGGSHNFESDRAFGRRVVDIYPALPIVLRENPFLRRWCAPASARVDQFLDLGSGIPTVGNVHEVAHDQPGGADRVRGPRPVAVTAANCCGAHRTPRWPPTSTGRLPTRPSRSGPGPATPVAVLAPWCCTSCRTSGVRPTLAHYLRDVARHYLAIAHRRTACRSSRAARPRERSWTMPRRRGVMALFGGSPCARGRRRAGVAAPSEGRRRARATQCSAAWRRGGLSRDGRRRPRTGGPGDGPGPGRHRGRSSWAVAGGTPAYVPMDRGPAGLPPQPRHRSPRGLHRRDLRPPAAVRVGAALVDAHFTETGSIERTPWPGRARARSGVRRRGAPRAAGRRRGRLRPGPCRTAPGASRSSSARPPSRPGRVEQARWDSEARFRTVFAEAVIGIGLADTEGRSSRSTTRWPTCSATPRTRCAASTIWTFVHPDDVPGLWERTKELLAGERDHLRVEKAYTAPTAPRSGPTWRALADPRPRRRPRSTWSR